MTGTTAVWFSCGAASAVALKTTIEQYPEYKVVALNNPVDEELPDNRRFLDDVSNWLNIEIQNVQNTKYGSTSAVDVWTRESYMSNPSGAPCTRILKQDARKQWEKENQFDDRVLGFTADEQQRHDDYVERGTSLLPVLIDAGITKGECYRIIQDAGIELPESYRLGYPNANCIGCVKASSPTYWNHVRKVHPDVFEQRAVQSYDLGARLVRVKGERIFLKDLDSKAVGRPMKDMNFECGIFCSAGNKEGEAL
jgi:3'-phosphoadenosine 5'-phosphosulfate sulfotransferase (PAPS reductase)/FAD synthetase